MTHYTSKIIRWEVNNQRIFSHYFARNGIAAVAGSVISMP
jgi:hypothetical protein